MTQGNGLAAVIILAAGKGTRIKSQTPKVLLEMCGRSLVGHANDAVSSLDPQYTVFVVRHERDQVVRHLEKINPQALIADQDDIKGTGRAAWCGMQVLPPDLHGPVLVLAGDSPMFTSQALADLLSAHDGNAVTVLSTKVADPHGYGRILRAAIPGSTEVAATPSATGNIIGIVEEKDASDLERQIDEIGTSTYIFDAQFLRESLETLGTDNAQGEMYLTDVIARAAALDAGVGSYVLADSIQAEGVNDLVQLATLRAEKNRRTIEAWMRSGVAIIDPLTTVIDVDVTLEPDAVIQPGTILRGNTHIGAFAVVGPNTELRDVQVGQRAVVPHSVLVGTTVPADKQLAAFTVTVNKTE
ncbi:bifunctional UDP-N-acetylglucosamine pyrophosphorylase/glucosamine-1-phosphate N-acetyltransferase [Arcanobacterium pluranimalium]|uniref:NTP transferase domain-containing protein n=1 Tax=Arcanobacterium pluranimalium TaxID=108028 RepID=UPI003083F99F|nr:bifunctional UDP-N-acetylglucosamine pyrophosphorylase/glucosamine-1-phosphate N-acetyltransferase [Arcanobacterium pluranimalium]